MIHWLNAKLRDYFGFSQTETRGVIVLLFLIVIFLTLPPALKAYYQATHVVSYEQDIALLDSLLDVLEATQQALPPKEHLSDGSAHLPRLFPCGNVLQDKGTIVNKSPHRNKRIKPFSINSADTTQLKVISGIGSILARRIVKYRDKLGGFIRKDQYQEIYGLRTAALAALVKQTYIAPNFKPRRLNINTCHLKELAAHPYVSYEQAKNLVCYRAQHGSFTAVEDLRALALIDEATLEKIAPYLAVE